MCSKIGELGRFTQVNSVRFDRFCKAKKSLNPQF
jgi:hypothetical protein